MLPPGVREAAVESAAFFVHLGVVLGPLFLAGSFLVGVAQEYLPAERVERSLRRHDGGTGNVVAAGVGAVTPFCSCSTVPLVAGLLQAGAPLGLTFSFLLASPLVNEIAVVLLVGLFGLRLTLLYVVGTFLAAVVGGVVVGRFDLAGHVKPLDAFDGQAVATDGGAGGECGCDGSDVAPTREASVKPGRTGRDSGDATDDGHRKRLTAAARGAWSFVADTWAYLLLGMTVGALIHGAVPVAVVRTVLGPENPLAVPLAAMSGAPVYVSMSGMLPIAASLADQGVPVGTVLAFVVGGAGVSLPNLVLLNRLFDRHLLAVYAATVVAIGVALGTVFNAVVA